MHSTDPLLSEAERLRPYKRHRFPLALKVRAVRIFLAGASLRRTARVFRYGPGFSHEAVRQWAHRLSVVFRPRILNRKIVIVDETSIFLKTGREVFEWVAIDYERNHVILTWLTEGRGGLDALLFMKAVLRRCTEKPFVMVDRGVWYPWALNTLDIPWKVQRGGPRSLVESYFGSLKTRLRPMTRRPLPWHTMTSVKPYLALHAWEWNENH